MYICVCIYAHTGISGNHHTSLQPCLVFCPQDAARTGGANGLGELAEALRDRYTVGRW